MGTTGREQRWQGGCAQEDTVGEEEADAGGEHAGNTPALGARRPGGHAG